VVKRNKEVLSILSTDQVRQLAVDNRVRAARNYHADQHFVPWRWVVDALVQCTRVTPDDRSDDEGRRRHPAGHVAYGPSPRGFLRIDFNLAQEEGGSWLLVVTAFEVERRRGGSW
jgi:hypothetical protein